MTRVFAQPPGTRRDDTELFGAARSALDRHPGVPSTIHVHIENAVATLTGTARLASERAAAANVVRGVRGIGQVVNKIVVAQDASRQSIERPDEIG
jgi:osmotically-inducible protein OsmY